MVGSHYRKPVAYTDEAMEDAGRAVARVREAVRRLDPDAPPAHDLDALAERFFDALADDFNTPAARAVLFDWVAEANRRIDGGEQLGAGRLKEMLHALGLESLLEEAEQDAPEEIRAARGRARRGASVAGLRARRPPARRDREARLGDSRHGRRHAARAGDLRPIDRLRAQSGTGGAARPAPRPPRLRHRAGGAGGLAGRGRGGHGRAARDRGALRLGRPSGHLRRGRPIPTRDADSTLEAEDALVLCLDEVQDPQNLGAVCRVAEAAGCSGVVLPERRAAEVSAAVCKASAGAVEHLAVARVRNLADWLAEAKAQEAWVYGAEAGARVPYERPDYRGRVVLVLGSKGRACARVWRVVRRARGPAERRTGRLAQRGHGRRRPAVRNLALPQGS